MNELVSPCMAARLLAPGDRVAVAVSGGKDSMALLNWFFSSARGLGAEFFAVNVEHGIRGQNSVADSAFVRGYCKERGIEAVCFSGSALDIAKEKGITVEQAARELRYGFFDSLLNQGKCNKVATAHHKDDNAETVLMRIFRGTGVRGLQGIGERRGEAYIRPFITVSRAEIEEYVAKNGIPFVEDETNADDKYARNYLRNKVIPLIRAEYPSLSDSILRLSKNAAEAEEYLDCVTPDIAVKGDSAFFALDYPPLIIKRLALKCFRALGVYADVEERHLNILVDFARFENGKRLDMPYGVTAYKEYGNIALSRGEGDGGGVLAITLPFYGVFNGYKIEIIKYDGRLGKGELLISADKLPKDAVIRGRAEGDTFTKFGGGTKSLGDYYTDKKIPVRLRSRLPVIAAGSTVLALPGIEISRLISADDINASNENLYKITMEELI